MDICDTTDVFKITIKKYLPDKGDNLIQHSMWHT